MLVTELLLAVIDALVSGCVCYRVGVSVETADGVSVAAVVTCVPVCPDVSPGIRGGEHTITCAIQTAYVS